MSAQPKPMQSQSEVRTITAAEFKAKCLQLMDCVAQRNVTYIVTKRGKPVAQLEPVPPPLKPRSFIGATRGSLKQMGDIVSALPNEWAAEDD